ncbi:MAG TPA: M14 family zinc carboxypeptidase [Gemmatimonadaceae bacterium]|nr:M14 family zinc carboxypeptidase [Gemmatimonadaceae bacterium]
MHPQTPLLVAAIFALACASRPGTTDPDAPVMPARPVSSRPDAMMEMPRMPNEVAMRAGLSIANRYRVAAITHRRFTHDEYWRVIAPAIAAPAFRSEVIGQSMNGRDIRALTFGTGPSSVLLWSQMHGDESTASMSLADIFAFLSSSDPSPIRQRLHDSLTITFVPMLNPDGAELFQRQNAAGIDVNRDARELATPEARALKGIRDRLTPDFGFNLHDQSARTRAGQSGTQVAIALLAPAYDSSRSYDFVRSRARLVAAGIARTLQAEIPGRVAGYDDAFNPRAFGDLIQQWGTSTVLIESGALPDDPEKQRLRAITGAAILSALDAIATGSYRTEDTTSYESLPRNTGGAFDVLVIGGQLVLPGHAPLRADLALNYDEAVARTGPRIRDIGDLREAIALDTIDATGLFVHPDSAVITQRDGSRWLRLGAPGRLDIRRGATSVSPLVRKVE